MYKVNSCVLVRNHSVLTTHTLRALLPVCRVLILGNAIMPECLLIESVWSLCIFRGGGEATESSGSVYS